MVQDASAGVLRPAVTRAQPLPVQVFLKVSGLVTRWHGEGITGILAFVSPFRRQGSAQPEHRTPQSIEARFRHVGWKAEC